LTHDTLAMLHYLCGNSRTVDGYMSLRDFPQMFTEAMGALKSRLVEQPSLRDVDRFYFRITDKGRRLASESLVAACSQNWSVAPPAIVQAAE
jgi:hypothetical protein